MQLIQHEKERSRLPVDVPTEEYSLEETEADLPRSDTQRCRTPQSDIQRCCLRILLSPKGVIPCCQRCSLDFVQLACKSLHSCYHQLASPQHWRMKDCIQSFQMIAVRKQVRGWNQQKQPRRYLHHNQEKQRENKPVGESRPATKLNIVHGEYGACHENCRDDGKRSKYS